MSPENIASRLGRRPGHRLLTYREVGLPLWDMPLRCLFLAKKKLPAIDEFILRSVEAGLQVSSDIAAFLGLPPRVVEAVMGSLVTSGNLTPTVDSRGSVMYVLTKRGLASVSELSQVVPEERTIHLAYDGLVHQFLHVEQSLRWRPQDLKRNELLEIPAFPADPPQIDPFVTTVVANTIRAETTEAGQELLAVIGLDGKREKFFRKAIALVFQSLDRKDDVSVQFAIDGRLSDDHSSAFAKAEGRRKLGIVGMLQDSSEIAPQVLGEAILSQVADESEVSALRHATDGFREQLSQLKRKSEQASAEQRERLAMDAERVEQRIDSAEAALSRLPVRLLEVHEHPALLDDALTTAEERLLIVSPWIRDAVVNDAFIAKLEALTQKAVEITIAYGIDDGKRGSGNDSSAEQRLTKLSESKPNFNFVRLGDTHAKILLVDGRFVVVTSYNWLSFRGDPNRPFRDERGTLVTISEEIDRIYHDYITRIAGK